MVSIPYWLMIPVAMLVGFCIAYPMNGGLIKTGIKEKRYKIVLSF